MRKIAVLLLSMSFVWLPARAIDLDALITDEPTLESLGFSVPVTGGTFAGGYAVNAEIRVQYRELGSSTWRDAMALHRVKPQYVSASSVGEQFAGSVLGLTPGTRYEVNFVVDDPAEGAPRNLTLTPVQLATRDYPPDNPTSPDIVNVANVNQLRSAVASADSGDVIVLADGLYDLGGNTLEISAGGTADNPIIIRGASESGATIDGNSGNDETLRVSGSYVTLEDLRIVDSRTSANSYTTAIRLFGEGNPLSDVTVRNLYVHANLGIDAAGGENRRFTIYGNLLEGALRWPHTGFNQNYEGIQLTGEGHAVFNNTVSGFEDAIGSSGSGDINFRANDFYRNEVLYNADDGIELDHSERNVRAWDNRVTNTHHGISFQPAGSGSVTGGPNYVFRNVVYNAAQSPLKLNDAPVGSLIINNTFVKFDGNVFGVEAWLNYGDGIYDFVFHNNLFMSVPGSDNVLEVSDDLIATEVDYNGYYPDGDADSAFRLDNTFDNLADLQATTNFEQNGLILDGGSAVIFANTAPDPTDYRTQMAPQDVRLATNTKAIDRAKVYAGINDGFSGNAPDLGAIELGDPLPAYGSDFTAPPGGGGGGSGGGGGAGGSSSGSTGISLVEVLLLLPLTLCGIIRLLSSTP